MPVSKKKDFYFPSLSPPLHLEWIRSETKLRGRFLTVKKEPSGMCTDQWYVSLLAPARLAGSSLCLLLFCGSMSVRPILLTPPWTYWDRGCSPADIVLSVDKINSFCCARWDMTFWELFQFSVLNLFGPFLHLSPKENNVKLVQITSIHKVCWVCFIVAFQCSDRLFHSVWSKSIFSGR